ncbi:unnamed protein product [Phytophthora fragariaefolia]|uniref:Unnamed protein product n=1 Tax=Phytophthora fragariaefolia TaxID=1490495 RepID=A0A9W6UCQ0_9STRA|nr:unnamed protein product [Phytophthora fragariaefolia]
MLGSTKPHHCFAIDGASGKHLAESSWSDGFVAMVQATYRVRLHDKLQADKAPTPTPAASEKQQQSTATAAAAGDGAADQTAAASQPKHGAEVSSPNGSASTASAPATVSGATGTPASASNDIPPTSSNAHTQEQSRKRQLPGSDEARDRNQKAIRSEGSSRAGGPVAAAPTDGMSLYDRVKAMHDMRAKAAKANASQAPLPKMSLSKLLSQQNGGQQQKHEDTGVTKDQVQLEQERAQMRSEQQPQLELERAECVQVEQQRLAEVRRQMEERLVEQRQKLQQEEKQRQEERQRQEELKRQEEQKQQEELRRQAEEQRQEELHRQAEQQQQEEKQRQEERQRQEELKRQEEQKQQEELRRQAEQLRQEELRRQAEQQRQEELRRQAEEQRQEEQRWQEEQRHQRLLEERMRHEHTLRQEELRRQHQTGHTFVSQAQHAQHPQSGFAVASMPLANISAPMLHPSHARFTRVPSPVSVPPHVPHFESASPSPMAQHQHHSGPSIPVANGYTPVDGNQVYHGHGTPVSRFETIAQEPGENHHLVVRNPSVQQQEHQQPSGFSEAMVPHQMPLEAEGFSPSKTGEDDELRAIWVSDYDNVNTLVSQLDKEILKRTEEGHSFVHMSNNITIPEQLKLKINQLRAQRDAAVKKRFESVVRVLIFSDAVRSFDQQNEHTNIWSDVPEVLKASHKKCAELATDIREFERQAQKLREGIDEAVSSGNPAQMQNVPHLGALIADLERQIRASNSERDKQFIFMFQFCDALRNMVRSEWAAPDRGYQLPSSQ